MIYQIKKQSLKGKYTPLVRAEKRVVPSKGIIRFAHESELLT